VVPIKAPPEDIEKFQNGMKYMNEEIARVTVEAQTPSTHQSKSGHAAVATTSLPDEVVQAASRLWKLFPVLAKSRFVATKARIEAATSDLNQLRQWAVEQPGCNWGLATGQASGVFVLEMHAALGANALRALCDEDWDWATGLQSRAGEAGHAFFHWPQGMAVRASAKNLAPGLCIRGDGDYVLVPPSMSAGISHVYCDPDAVIATTPQWLLQSAFSFESSDKILVFSKLAPQLAPFAANSTKLSGRKLLSFPGRTSNDQHYRVYMSFDFRDDGGWHCEFLDKDLRTVLPRVLTLATFESVVALAERGGCVMDLQSRQMLDRALAAGRGGVLLELCKDQYSKLLQTG
jgi:hypothetical protein